MLSVPDAGFLGRRVKAVYGLRGPVRVFLHTNGVNLTYFVRARGSRSVLRIYSPAWRSRRQIDFELKQLLHLHGLGIPVSWPLPAKDGSLTEPLLLPEGPSHAALFTYAKPGLARRSKAAVYRGLGKALAGLHQAQSAFKARAELPDLDEAGLIDRSLRHLRPYRLSFGKQWPLLLAIAGKVRAKIARLPKGEPEYGLIHGDAHLGNVNHDDASGEDVWFDFDLSCRGWRLFDLATLLWVDDLNGAKPAQLRKDFKVLCAAYASWRRLSDLERKLLPDMMAARHIWYMGFQAQGAGRWGANMVDEQTHAWKMGFLKRWNKGEIRKILR